MEAIEVSLYREGGGESITLDPTGTTGNPLVLIEGSEGLGMAPAEWATSPRLAGHGSTVRGGRLSERSIFVPFLVDAPTSQEYDMLMERLSRLVSPLDPARLMLRVQPYGRETYREIEVRYKGGLDSSGGTYRGTWGTVGLELMANEALWSGSAETAMKQVAPGSKPFISATVPFLPVTLSESVVAGQVVVEVRGDAPTWPRWTVTPPGSDLLISHINSKSQFQLLGSLTEPVVIDMGTGSLTSKSKPLGELWDQVPANRGALFELRPGRNVMNFSMVGATTASMVHMEYRPQYLRGQ